MTATLPTPIMTKIILDLCGGSGSWSAPYLRAGYAVRLITLPEDVRLIKYPEQVYGILAAPPCTMFANSGNRWVRTRKEMLKALSIVDACLRLISISSPHFWALENPVGKLKGYLGRPRLYFDPCDYGDPYRKRTCLWGNFNIPKPSTVVPVKNSPIHYMAPGPERATLRSITPPGFAKAFFEANR